MPILTYFCVYYRKPNTGGRINTFIAEQEAAIVDKVVAKKTIRQIEIQAAVFVFVKISTECVLLPFIKYVTQTMLHAT